MGKYSRRCRYRFFGVLGKKRLVFCRLGFLGRDSVGLEKNNLVLIFELREKMIFLSDY